MLLIVLFGFASIIGFAGVLTMVLMSKGHFGELDTPTKRLLAGNEDLFASTCLYTVFMLLACMPFPLAAAIAMEAYHV